MEEEKDDGGWRKRRMMEDVKDETWASGFLTPLESRMPSLELKKYSLLTGKKSFRLAGHRDT